MRKLWAAVAVVLIIPAASVFSQEWSAAQKEVWKNVLTYNAVADSGNLEGFMAYIHNDYMGWNYESAMPMNKAAVRKFVEHELATEKVIVDNITPVAIGVFGNFAFADYCYMLIYKDSEGKEKSSSGRWTDILMKQGDKWVLIGDHGGRTSKE